MYFSTSVISIGAGLPNIKGELFTVPANTSTDGTGAFRRTTTPNTAGAARGAASWSNINFDASRSSSVYGSSSTVTPLSESTLLCIRY